MADFDYDANVSSFPTYPWTNTGAEITLYKVAATGIGGKNAAAEKIIRYATSVINEHGTVVAISDPKATTEIYMLVEGGRQLDTITSSDDGRFTGEGVLGAPANAGGLRDHMGDQAVTFTVANNGSVDIVFSGYTN